MQYIAQHNMIKQQLRATAVLDEHILSLFESIPREQFVPPAYQAFAYSDMQIPFNHTQRMMTPSEEGLLLQALKLQGHETVLEIGTGTGFLTALLSRLCKKVVSVDIDADLITQAKKKLNKHDCHNVELYCGNAYEGWPSLAPYDCIVYTGALAQLKEALFVQLQPQGHLFAVLGKGNAMQGQLYTLQANKMKTLTFIFNTNLPELTPMHSVHSFIF
ncbi:MAG: protein-L-isoaspartate O-methyltransferase [Gammaproteobacteria bacterium]|nr:protein-L-isoaspartate O-methyltransferase [Gammaproteobacteria bacterium]